MSCIFVGEREMATNKHVLEALMGTMMLFQNPYSDRISCAPRKSRQKSHPWDGINIPKAERKGKSYEEVQELRAQKWLKLNGKEIDTEPDEDK